MKQMSACFPGALLCNFISPTRKQRRRRRRLHKTDSDPQREHRGCIERASPLRTSAFTRRTDQSIEVVLQNSLTGT